ncbi:hypothetical protein [Streptomyces sp. CT34]|nr:hypothetical protein [Streptomyces sp. CT34]
MVAEVVFIDAFITWYGAEKTPKPAASVGRSLRPSAFGSHRGTAGR